MDLLCKAYSNDSDDEAKPEPEPQPEIPLFPSSKRPKLDARIARQTRGRVSGFDSPIAGRYVSKRERAVSGACSLPAGPDPDDASPASLASGSLSDSKIRADILSLLRNKAKSVAPRSRMPEKDSIPLSGHTKAVNAVHWSPTHAHLLASASMDKSVCIWNPWSNDQKMARKLSFHKAAILDVKWSPHGSWVLSCGYDCTMRLIDVEKGMETHVFDDGQTVSVVKFHNYDHNLFISGGSQGSVKLWDVRVGKTVHEYSRGREPVLDVEFSRNGKQIISSSDVSRTNVSENSIVVWDISREIPLSNQVYVEAFTCPCVRIHPVDPVFVAQSNGNYVAIFSSSPPFKLNKYKRFEGHGVSAFPVKCNFSSNGDKLISGSSDGYIYFYDYKSSQLVRKIKAYEQPCIDVVVHPVLTNVVAACSWGGEVSVFE